MLYDQGIRVQTLFKGTGNEHGEGEGFIALNSAVRVTCGIEPRNTASGCAPIKSSRRHSLNKATTSALFSYKATHRIAPIF